MVLMHGVFSSPSLLKELFLSYQVSHAVNNRYRACYLFIQCPHFKRLTSVLADSPERLQINFFAALASFVVLTANSFKKQRKGRFHSMING